MSQYSYTKKPNFLGDASRNRAITTILSTVQSTIFPTYKGWMSPMAGIGFTVGTAFVWSASVVTVTSVAHGLVTGGYTMITGVVPAAYNGYFPVTVTGPDTFTYPLTSNPGTALVAQTVTAQSWYNGVLTLTVPSHGFQASDFQAVLAAFVPTSVNMATEVDVIDANTIAFLVPVNPTITTLGTITPQASVYRAAEVLVAIGELDQLFADAFVVPTFTAAISYSGTLNTVTANTITVTVTSSEPIIITGSPTITLAIGSVVRNMVYDAANSSTTVLLFKYVVVAGDSAGLWTASRPYAVNSVFLQGSTWYTVNTAYTSGTVFNNLRVSALAVATAGSGYPISSTQVVTFTGGTAVTAATASATINASGVVTAFTLLTGGEYSVAPTGVTVAGGGTLAAATITTVQIDASRITASATSGVVVGSSISGQLGVGDILTPIGTVSGALNPVTSTAFTPITTPLTTVN
jgi:hypothetical protein